MICHLLVFVESDTIHGMIAPRLYLLSLVLCSTGTALSAQSAQATGAFGMPAVFSDHMVLQAGAQVPVWGWAKPGAKISVTFAGQQKNAIADAKGRWRTDLSKLTAGGPHEMVVSGGETIRWITDVLVGEVWLGSGQSNMAMRVNGCVNAEQEIASAKFPKIRMFTVGNAPKKTAQRNCKGSWVVCSPATVKSFSATAYFFGRRLHQELSVPVGLINSSVGGTPIEAWTSMPVQSDEPQLANLLGGWRTRRENWKPITNAQFKKNIEKWTKRVENAKAKGRRAPRKPRQQNNPTLGTAYPANLFHGMIHPLIPYRIRGALWYQGERNARNVVVAQLYRVQLPLLIKDWRARWNQGEFPFLFVQLPNFKKRQNDPNAASAWATLRESMLQSLSVSNTGMATTIDVGMAGNIHPKNKQAVGSRLAQWALSTVYEKPIPASGPLFANAKFSAGSALVSFRASSQALCALSGDVLRGFAIAGEDRLFKFAKAEIRGAQVKVWHPEISTPVAVRYAWGDNPDCNFGNAAKLPASPFRSDTWKLK